MAKKVIHARENVRHDSFVARAATGVICGLGVQGYVLAVEGLAAVTGAAGKR